MDLFVRLFALTLGLLIAAVCGSFVVLIILSR